MDAIASYDRAISTDSNQPDFHNNRGVALAQTGSMEAAQASYARALAIDPDHADSHVNLGILLGNMGRFAEALASFERALAAKPDHPVAMANRIAALNELHPPTPHQPEQVGRAIAEGLSLGRAGRHSESLAAFDSALRIDPTDPYAMANRGAALMALDRPAEALASFDNALRRGLNDLALHTNRAAVASQLGNLAEAIRSYDSALMLDLGNVDLLRARSEALWKAGRTPEAIESFEALLSVVPDDRLALNRAGVAQESLGYRALALEKFDRAITLHPNDPIGHINRAEVLQGQRRYDEARQSLSRALELDPALPFGNGQLLHLNLTLADWKDFDRLTAEVAASVRQGACGVTPFALLALIDDPALHRLAAKTFFERVAGGDYAEPEAPKHSGGKIRLGYFSSDFHDHATMFLIAEVIEAHDRERFEVFGYSFGLSSSQTMRGRAEAAFDRFSDVRALTAKEIAARSRADGIDIAIDLKGFTEDCRPAIFAARAAPIQINYLGYPGTIPSPRYDYLIGDEVVIAEDHRSTIAERIIYLPNSYQPNCRHEVIVATPERAAAGLPENGFVFGCLNQVYKILPHVFERWMNILRVADGSVLWLLSSDAIACANLRREAEARGVDGSRLHFAKKVDRAAHLARLRLVDLFLDTMPYNAHTTASDALRMGVPVLTCPGRSFASRVAASLLTSVGMEVLIAPTIDDYEAMAVDFAHDAERLAELRIAISENVAQCALFDSVGYARSLEEGFTAAHKRYLNGEKPTDIWVGKPQSTHSG